MMTNPVQLQSTQIKYQSQGEQIWAQSGSDWSQMRQIWVIFRSDSEPKCSESALEKSRICPIWGQSDPL